MASLGDLVVNLKANTQSFRSNMRKADQAVSGFARRARKSLTSVSAIIAGAGGSALLAGSVKLAAEVETLAVQFEVLTGSAATAAAVLKDVRTFAATTPFQKIDIAAAARQLLAFGSDSRNLTSELRMLGNIAAGTGNSIGELAELFGKARVQGRLFKEDLNQLVGRGINVMPELARHFGVTQAALLQLVSDGKVGFEQLNVALMALTESGGQFAGMTQRLSQTTAGKLSTLKDKVAELGAEIGTGLLPVLNELIDKLTQLEGGGSGPTQWIKLLNVGALKAQENLHSLWLDIKDIFDLRDFAANLNIKGRAEFAKGDDNAAIAAAKRAMASGTARQIAFLTAGVDSKTMGLPLPGAGEVIPDPVGPQIPQDILNARRSFQQDAFNATALSLLLASSAGSRVGGSRPNVPGVPFDTFKIAAGEFRENLNRKFTMGNGLPGIGGLAGIGLHFGQMAQQAAAASPQTAAPLQFAGAAEAGSAEALNIIAANMRGTTKTPEVTAIEKQTQELKKAWQQQPAVELNEVDIA